MNLRKLISIMPTATQQEIADAGKVTTQAVSACMKRMGIHRLEMIRENNAALRDRASLMRGDGLTLQQMSGKLGKHPTVIGALIRGIPLPKRETKTKHGTATRYKNHNCRCDACKQANKESRKYLKGKQPKQHGTYSAYTNYGCRCLECRAANAKYAEQSRLELAKRRLNATRHEK